MNANFSYHSRSHVGLVRKANEDSFGDEQTLGGHVFVVCDGMGGHVGGAKASKLAVDSILEFFRNNSDNDPAQLIHDAIIFANMQVHGHASEFPEFNGMGTTCVVLYIQADGKIYHGHVGDSRIYAYQKGKLQRLTKDHSYVQFLVDTGEITEEEMETHPKKNQILKALGIDEAVKPDVNPTPIIPEDGLLFLLCSDGLNGMVIDSDIRAHLDKFEVQNLEQITENLINHALTNGGKDNVTATLIHYKSAVAKDPTLNLSAKSGNTRGFARRNILFMVLIGLIATIALVYAFTRSNTTPVTEDKKETQDSAKILEKQDSAKNTKVENRTEIKDSSTILKSTKNNEDSTKKSPTKTK